MTDREKLAALLQASNNAYEKGFNLDHHIAISWVHIPESTRVKWRNRADIFNKIMGDVQDD